MPRSLLRNSNLKESKGLVKIYANVCSNGTNSRETTLSSTSSLMKWWWISMCLVSMEMKSKILRNIDSTRVVIMYHYKENVKRWRFLSIKIYIRWRFPKASYLRLTSYEFPIVDAFQKRHLLWRLTMTLIESVIILNLGAL